MTATSTRLWSITNDNHRGECKEQSDHSIAHPRIKGRVQATRELCVNDRFYAEWQGLYDATERIDRNGMAHVWAQYVFYLDGVPHHCGHESYVLFRTADGWKIVTFADTDTPLACRNRKAGCAD